MPTDSSKNASHLRYLESINEGLRPCENGTPLVLDLFAGCGGLSLGFEAEGFATLGWELEKDYAATYNANLSGKCHITELTPGSSYPDAKVVIGGPPCQPFSVGGRQLGLADSRDGFPTFISCIRQVQPEIWMFENVRGMMYRNKWYLEEVVDALAALDYVVEFKLLNARNYGVPQNRERVFVVGHRGRFQYPEKKPELVTAGDAVCDWAVQTPPESKFLTPSQDAYIAKYEKASDCINPRDLHMHKPSRTLTCRNLAGATGDMMRVRLADGRRRRLLLQEAARLQTFPDWFDFAGNENSQFYQIGNAVPPVLAKQLARSVRMYLNSEERLTSDEISKRVPPKQMGLPGM